MLEQDWAPLSHLDVFIVRLASVVIGLSVWMGLWMLFNAPQSYAVSFGFAAYIVTHVVFDKLLRSSGTRGFEEGREARIRVRIAELDSKIEAYESEKARRLHELETLQTDTRIYGGEENIREYPRREKQILDKLDAIDREIEPKLKKRAKLSQEFDELLQKKGYR